jgi:pimeloyl-ACP methyl ester carboxylesterase
VLCLPGGAAAFDPAPDETERRDVELVSEWDGTPAGIVGVGEGGWRAVELAAEHGDLVQRVVLVSTPVPDGHPSGVSAKTLLLYGSKDPAGGHKQATWWKERLGGRIEMVPGADADILERVWPRVLSHLAPGQRRKD